MRKKPAPDPIRLRVLSPPGGSTLITSAPRSPRIMPQVGPITMWENSTTRMPVSGRRDCRDVLVFPCADLAGDFLRALFSVALFFFALFLLALFFSALFLAMRCYLSALRPAKGLADRKPAEKADRALVRTADACDRAFDMGAHAPLGGSRVARRDRLDDRAVLGQPGAHVGAIGR